MTQSVSDLASLQITPMCSPWEL